MSNEKQLTLKLGGASCVKFSPSENERIQKDSFKLSKSVPTLLKDAYFDRLPTKVLVNQTDLMILRKDLNKIGNNINQIARKINSGLMDGWSASLEKIHAEFHTLTQQIHFGYGIRKG